MESYGANEARLKMRDILTAVERGQHVELKKYATPTGVIVPQEWYERMLGLLGIIDQIADVEMTDEAWRVIAHALLDARRARGLHPQDPRVVHHLDGDPTNNDVANLVVMDPKENTR